MVTVESNDRRGTVRRTSDAEVRYTVKELLKAIRDDQTAGFASLTTALANKADKSDIARMEARLDHAERDIAGLKQARDDQNAAARGRQEGFSQGLSLVQKLGAGLVGLAIVAGPIIAVITAH